MPRLERAADAYMQVAAYLRKKIVSGDFKPGDKLPGNAVLAKEFEVSVLTTYKAVQVLVEEGLVRTEHRKGSFVRDPSVWKINQNNP